jgi:ligand-binding sensor domain-containing protein
MKAILSPGITLLLLLGFSTLIIAQPADNPHAIWDQTVYSIKNGTPIPQLTCSYTDKSGAIWAGGQGGLFRFDGYTYTPYTAANGLRNTWVQYITGDSNGVIYAATVGGLAIIRKNKVSLFQLVRDSVKRVDVVYVVNKNELLVASRNEIWSVKTSGDSLKAQHLFSLTVPDSKRVSYIMAYGLARDAQNRIYVSTNRGFFIYANHKLQSIAKWSLQVEIDQHQNIWFSTAALNKLEWVAGEPKVTTFPLFPEYPAESPYNKAALIFKIDKNNILAFTNTPGPPLPGKPAVEDGYYFLSVFSIPTEQFRHIKGVVPASLGFLTGVTTDKEGSYWLASAQGLSRLRLLDHITTTAFTDEVKQVAAITEARNGALHVSTESDGLYTVTGNHLEKDKSWGKPATAGGLDSAVILDLCEAANGDFWYVTDNQGIYRRSRNNKVTHYTRENGLGTNIFTCVLQARNGLIYFGGWNAIAICNGDSITPLQASPEFPVNNAVVSNLTEDSMGNILFATSAGLYSYRDGKAVNVSKQLGIEGVIISAVCPGKDGSLWVGTYGKGLLQVSLVAGGYKTLQTLTTANGLCDNFISCVDIDAEKRVWASSFGGYHLVTPGKVHSQVIRITSQMLMDKYYWRGMGIFCDSKGNVLAFTANGILQLTISHQSAIEQVATTTPLFITGFQVFNKDLDIPAQQRFPFYLNVPEHPVLAYDQNHITINFGSIYYTDPANLKYSYLLEGGSGSEWTAPSEARSVTYSKLPPGNYIFKVRTDVNGNLTPVTEYAFTIQKPWWQTAWFRTLLVLLLLGATWGVFNFFYRRKISRARAAILQLQEAAAREQEMTAMEQSINENKLKALQAQMNPHFIFNVLSSLQHFIRQGDSQKSEQLLLDFGGLIRKSLDISGQSYISVQQEINYLEEYIRVEQQRTAHQFQFHIHVEKNFVAPESYFMPGMLLQPIVENAILHGLLAKQAQPAILDISLKMLPGNLLECIVKDNGPGIREQAGKSHKPVAMGNVRQRLSLYSRHVQKEICFEIENISGSGAWLTGTKVTIQIPCLALATVHRNSTATSLN